MQLPSGRLRLEGKVAIVTGAGSSGPGFGTGKATSILFAQEGAKVLLVDRDVRAAEETLATIREQGGEASVFEADVTSAHDCQAMAAAAVERFGALHVLFNNVGISGPGSPTDVEEEVWDRVLGVNLKSMMLGTKYSETLGAKFLDSDGKKQPILMGSYGIGITRTPQAALERYCDDKGIIWPKNIAPYLVQLIPLKMDSPEQVNAADKIYEALREAGIEVLYDDRNDRPGVKFNDADLIGLPIRITIGDKSLKDNKVELKARAETDMELVDLENVVEAVKNLAEKLN